MAQSIRMFYHGQQGAVRQNVNWPPINKHSAVQITAAEWLVPVDPGFKLEDQRPHLGAAAVWVSNVGAHGGDGEAGGVEFMLHVDAGNPLGVMVTITVLEDIVQFAQA